MLEAITRRLKRLNCNKQGVSNVLVVMLSLILITVIVANVILWNYQMNQLDIERMHESVSITNADRITHSQWFTAQNEFLITTGTRISGSYPATTSIDSSYEIFREEPAVTYSHSHPSSYNPLGGTRYVSGLLTDLQSNDSVYMTFSNVDEHFVDQTSNVDNSPDKGTHSNFDFIKASPDGNYDILTEGDYGSYATITYVGAGAKASGTGSVNPALPTGWQPGDIFLLFCETANEPVTAPAGWTQIPSSPQGTGTAGGTSATRLTVFWRRATSSETAPTIADPGDHICAAILAFRNVVETSDPWDVTVGDVLTTSSTSVTIPGATTTVPGCMVVVAVATGPDTNTAQCSGWTNPNLSSLAELVDYYTNAGNGGGFAVAAGIMTNAGNYGPTTATVTTSFVQGRISIALKPKRIPNYQLDLEVQWTNANYTRTNEYLCIYTGSFSGSENLRVDVWTGSTWETIIDALQPNAWNNVSVSAYLTSSNFTIRFKDTVESNDSTQSSWQIDCALLRLGNNYIQVELGGALNVQNLTRLIWAVDCSFATDLINATFQLYDYQAGEYPTGGDGYMAVTIGTSDVTLNQTITTNPTRFIDANGNWKMKITGTKATADPFILKVDWVELEATLSNIYRLEISNDFTIDLSTYPLDYLYGVEILVRYNVSEATEHWFIKAYDWTSDDFSDVGFNNTSGNMPTSGEWNDYAVSINENWTRYIGSDGTIRILFCDEGVGENQTLVHVDFIGVRVILNGIRLDIKNSGAVTAHIVSVWIINATHHMRYNADFFINPGEAAVYIRVDIAPPAGDFTVKIVTERGNIDTF